MDDSQTVKGETPALADVIGPPPPDVNMHLDADIDAGIVRMVFNQPVTNVALRPGACRDLSKVLKEMANQVDRVGEPRGAPPRGWLQRPRKRSKIARRGGWP